MHQFIDCSDAYSKTSGRLWHSKEPALDGTKK